MHETSKIGNKVLMHKEIEFQSKKIESQSKRTQENSSKSLYFHCNYNCSTQIPRKMVDVMAYEKQS